MFLGVVDTGTYLDLCVLTWMRVCHQSVQPHRCAYNMSVLRCAFSIPKSGYTVSGAKKILPKGFFAQYGSMIIMFAVFIRECVVPSDFSCLEISLAARNVCQGCWRSAFTTGGPPQCSASLSSRRRPRVQHRLPKTLHERNATLLERQGRVQVLAQLREVSRRRKSEWGCAWRNQPPLCPVVGCDCDFPPTLPTTFHPSICSMLP